MQESRNLWFRRKPKLVLDGRFPWAHDLVVGEKGQLSANVEVVSMDTEVDADGNDIRIVTLKMTSGDLIKEKPTRNETKTNTKPK